MTDTDPNLDPAYAAALLRRAKALQSEADEVMRTLEVMTMLGALGHPEQIGSSVSGLMVWRDIDVTVRCRDVTLRAGLGCAETAADQSADNAADLQQRDRSAQPQR